MANPEIDKNKKSCIIELHWLIGALVVVFFALFLSSTIFRTNNTTSISCHCAQGPAKYSEDVEKCCCDYETVNHLNKEVLHPVLQELVKTPFFRYFKGLCSINILGGLDVPVILNSHIGHSVSLNLSFSTLLDTSYVELMFLLATADSVPLLSYHVLRLQVKLWCDCPFWPDDGMCHLRDCSVCECPENEFPEPFKAQSHRRSSSNLVCLEENTEGAVDRTIDSKAFKGWVEVDNPWTNDDETDNAEMTYVNLQLNPERYTGYSGSSARRIWDAVYIENCPKYPSGEICPEKKILYKLISGLHSSISIHIAAEYLLDEASNTWGQNLTLMYDRVLQFPDRVDNLYFTFLFVLRVVTKAADYLDEASYDTGNPEDDLKTQSWVKQLVYNPKLKAACPLPFAEARLWKGQGEPDLMQQIQTHALMDCIGCEKCRLWGKLQVLGLGTALKILFSVNGQKRLGETLHLQRNEVIALINLLNRLSESLMLVHEMGPSLENVMGKQTSTPSDQPSMTGSF
ncbi:hypothetical protein RND71_035424 [Anisodus tanguticus]|uniref:Uncharacterized protein n=1 Tax=Anisodus tanguticus TaxID=243964 RepID=A0AAE1UUG2_9SOLA|nr:hypothetical protein RND71_035424 [Anisodus tanguticus]